METPNGLIQCACGKTSNFGRVDKVEYYSEIRVKVIGECHVCLDARADADETARVQSILGLNENQNANPNGTTPADAGK